MSSQPHMSMDEREARAEARVAELQRKATGNLSTRSSARDVSARGVPSTPTPQRGVPRPGESLFDNYANLQDPMKFSTDEEEVEELLRMGVGNVGLSAESEAQNPGKDCTCNSCQLSSHLLEFNAQQSAEGPLGIQAARPRPIQAHSAT